MSVPPSNRPPHWQSPESLFKKLNSQIGEKITESTPLIPDLSQLVTSYVLSPLTNWYRGLEQLEALPSQIPPLPRHIEQILNSDCPLYRGIKKADQTAYKVFETHYLTLIPQEFVNMEHLERKILQPYGQKKYNEEIHPFQSATYMTQGTTFPFLESEWILISKDLLPGSINKSWREQVALVTQLKKKSLLNYQIPTLQQGFAALALNQIATDEPSSLMSQSLNHTGKYTRVLQERTGLHLTIGNGSPSGIQISINTNSNHPTIGILVYRKL